MNLGSGQSYMDKLKARNIPPELQEAMAETAPEPKVEQEIPMVQISVEEWKRLTEAVRQMEALSAELSAQKADLKTSAESYATVMKKAAEAQKEATEKALHKITREAVEQVGKASEKASEVIDRRIRRDEAIWFLHLALTFLPSNTDISLMGVRGIGNLTDLFEDGEESEEEKRQIEARNAGSAIGAIAGLAAGVAIGLAEKQSSPDEDIDDGEGEGFDITM